MDVNRIKYNQDLISKKCSLEKELNNIQKNLKIQQQVCNHIFVTTGYVGVHLEHASAITECLFCSKRQSYEENDWTLSINASTYKSEEYGTGDIPQKRRARLNELQNLWIKSVEEEPTLTEAELKIKIIEEIEKDSEKNIGIQKTIGSK